MKRQSPWSQALRLAEQTPQARNRFVDFMRCVAITLVIIGHWLAAVSYLDNGKLILVHVTNLADWSHWVSWLFQVMPVFFIVGGYANAASWESARRNKRDFAHWIAVRLRRLVTPLMPLIVTWCLVTLLAMQGALDPALLQMSSRIALNPVWFLAIYLMLVLMTPLSHALWQHFGIGSFWGLAIAALLVDTLGLLGNVPLVRWLNYGFVWLAVSQLGHLWHAGNRTLLRRPLWWAAGGIGMMIVLVTVAAYPVSMVTVPGAELSNSRPPTIALLALAVTQFGLLLSVERRARQWLGKTTPWAVTILINGSIMTIFLWHLSALVVVVSCAYLLGGYGLGITPLTLEWALTRPAWIMVVALVLLLLVMLFARIEQRAKRGSVPPLSPWKAIVGTVLLCNGLALLALKGLGGEGQLGIQLFALVLFFSGGVLVSGQAIMSKAASRSA